MSFRLGMIDSTMTPGNRETRLRAAFVITHPCARRENFEYCIYLTYTKYVVLSLTVDDPDADPACSVR